MKALIKVGYACNDHCGFCHTLEFRDVQGSSEEVSRKIRRAKELGHTMVVLSGGEPTIRPELVDWASEVAALDMDFGLVTNGRMLAYPELVEKLLERRLRYVYLSLHGGTAKVHDLLVRSRAFEETHGALKNLSGRGLDLTANCVVTTQNVDHLRGLVDAVLAYPDVTLKFSMVEPKGGGDKLFARLMPRVTQVADAVCDAIAYGVERRGEARGPHFTHGALPLCLMPGLERDFDDLKTDGFASMIEVGEPDYFPVDDANKLQPAESCAGCCLSGACPGLYRGYFESFGISELHAQHGRPRSNSFNYRFLRLVARDLPEAHCPLRDGSLGVTPWDRGRQLFALNRGRLASYRADTRDFSDAEIAEIKHDLGQVYVDVSTKNAPDDFARDLVKLDRAPLCDDCSEREACSGIFVPRLEDVFGADDARLRALLRGLEGDVLDLGCGESPYAEELEPAAREGRLRYVGVDPSREQLTRLAERMPWAELYRGTAEQLPAEIAGRDFDHVLLLRSYNHLVRPDQALRACLSRSRPGGSLLLVDNVAFGLARTDAQTRRAEGSTAQLEHYRNDGAAQAHARLAAFGLELLERHDICAKSSNQWLLHYRVPDKTAVS
ncbi:MAG: radical SAM protein [Deltaproteobacteria bacterium]|nr:radical SAM protein [Deltaproteobacteria bacterium]